MQIHAMHADNPDYCKTRFAELQLRFEYACAAYTVAMFEARLAALNDESAISNLQQQKGDELEALDHAAQDALAAYVAQGIRMRKSSAWVNEQHCKYSQM